MDEENVVLASNGVYSAIKKNKIMELAGEWVCS